MSGFRSAEGKSEMNSLCGFVKFIKLYSSVEKEVPVPRMKILCSSVEKEVPVPRMKVLFSSSRFSSRKWGNTNLVKVVIGRMRLTNASQFSHPEL